LPTAIWVKAGCCGEGFTMAIIEEQQARISQLQQAHQEALNALLKMRLEGLNGRELASAIERAQRAANTLFAARLDEEMSAERCA
jgi:uncharacterized membrane protein